jgi:hypothetical protein
VKQYRPVEIAFNGGMIALKTGQLTGGFGFINYVGGSTFQPPRQGTLEMRLQF